MADKNIQMTQRNASNTGWDNLYPITKASNVQVTPISGLSGNDVQTVLQNLFQFANDGKTAVANAITAKGVSASPSETFASLAAKIGQISTGKKWASGTASSTSSTTAFTFPNGTTQNQYFISVNGLSFNPSMILVYCITNNGISACFPEDVYSPNGEVRVIMLTYSTINYITNTNWSFKSTGVLGTGSFIMPVWYANSSYKWFAFE
jgi:hypothetical protein